MTLFEWGIICFGIWTFLSIFFLAHAGDKKTKELKEIKKELANIRNSLSFIFEDDYIDEFSQRKEIDRLTQREKDIIEYLGLDLYDYEWDEWLRVNENE